MQCKFGSTKCLRNMKWDTEKEEKGCGGGGLKTNVLKYRHIYA